MGVPTRLSRANFPKGPSARRASNDLFSVAIWHLDGSTEAKFACVVSKKIARQAVERNRLKRRCREAIVPLLASLNLPLAVVVYPKRAAANVPFEDVRSKLADLLTVASRPR